MAAGNLRDPAPLDNPTRHRDSNIPGMGTPNTDIPNMDPSLCPTRIQNRIPSRSRNRSPSIRIRNAGNNRNHALHNIRHAQLEPCQPEEPNDVE